MLIWTLHIAYLICAFCLLIYGINCYVMTFLFIKKRKNQKLPPTLDKDTKYPYVTTQIPVYNEFNVVERVINSVCDIDYPNEKHEIQILDDSNDETVELIDSIVSKKVKLGHNIKVVRRENRIGFKGGALQYGLKLCEGELIAIFDADFVPQPDFLKKTISQFVHDPKMGFVQARWGHLNSKNSLLTRAQALGIDGHFMVEQSSRAWNNLFLNFNGTAGLWRKEAILDAGDWQWDTLTEDMDLSYRVQLAGWNRAFLLDVVVPAELPDNIYAFKSQQFRWAKGSIQTALKLFPKIIKSEAGKFKKFQAFMHLTHYAIHPMMLCLAILSFPIVTWGRLQVPPIMYLFFFLMLCFSVSGPNALYVVSQVFIHHRKSYSKLIWLPSVVLIGVGLAVSNSKGVIEALFAKQSDFIRTPKKGNNEQVNYQIHLPKSVFFEIFIGFYCLFAFNSIWIAHRLLISPFVLIYGVAFLFVGILSLYTSFRRV